MFEMKKDKPFLKRGFFYAEGNTSWGVEFFVGNVVLSFGKESLVFGKAEKDKFRKFIKALRKGLRRLEK